MQTQIFSTESLHKFGSYLFNLGMVTGLATLTFGLISCGGGGGGGGAGTASSGTPTITSITPSGMVASSVSKTLSLLGTNFASGMTLSIKNSSGVSAGYVINSSSVTSSTVMTMNITIATAPSDNYVVVSVQKASGTPATAVLGVAGSDKRVATGIQTIFSPTCDGCHSTGSPVGGLDLSNATLGGSTGVIGISSFGCSSKLRVVPGDPRRTSSVLIDMIKFKAASSVPAALTCNNNIARQMPQGAAPALTPTQIQDIVDWVAGGAN